MNQIPPTVDNSRQQKAPKKSLLPILIIIGAVILLVSAVLFGLTEWNKMQTAELKEKETTAQTSIRTIESKSDFIMYRKTKDYLTRLSVVKYAPYGSSIYEIVKAPATVRSLQIQKDIDDNQDVHKAYLVLESYPPLGNAASLLETFTKAAQFSKAYLSSISSSRSETGQVLFSYPVTLTLSTRGNESAQ